MNWGLNPGRGKVFLFVKTLRPALRRSNLVINVYRFLPWQKSSQVVKYTTHFHLLLGIRMIGAIPLLLLYACMCEFLSRYFKTTLKIAVYVQMPQQLMVFMKNIFDFHYKNTVVRLECIAACFSSWRVGCNSRVAYLRIVVNKVARELGLSSEHFHFILHWGILSMPLHNSTCNLRDIQLPH